MTDKAVPKHRWARTLAIAMCWGLAAEVLFAVVGAPVGAVACLAGHGPADGWLPFALNFGASGR